jgi:hypothetical protein
MWNFSDRSTQMRSFPRIHMRHRGMVQRVKHRTSSRSGCLSFLGIVSLLVLLSMFGFPAMVVIILVLSLAGVFNRDGL